MLAILEGSFLVTLVLWSSCGTCTCTNKLLKFLYRSPEGQTPGGTQAVMIIGNNNVFEVGSCILLTHL